MTKQAKSGATIDHHLKGRAQHWHINSMVLRPPPQVLARI